MKELNRKELADLIRENVIEKDSEFKNSSLEEVINKAAKKVGAQKPADICFYIPYNGKRFHHKKMEKLKKESPEKLKNMIVEHILLKKPQRYRRNLETVEVKQVPTQNEYDVFAVAIKHAMEKIHPPIFHENDVRRYIPSNGRCMHFQTWKRMKKENPHKLAELIREHILSNTKPVKYKWFNDVSEKKLLGAIDAINANAKKNEAQDILITNSDSEKPLNDMQKLDSLLELAGEISQEIKQQNKTDKPAKKPLGIHDEGKFNIAERQNILFTDRYLRTIQNQLIKKIRQKEVDFELWDTFVDFIEGQKLEFS
ncbi:MAG: hypothetical protein KDK96_09275 [Chlamydiia bacterium]|nr:hypothetical protein [Chlamydiia bacterium]